MIDLKRARFCTQRSTDSVDWRIAYLNSSDDPIRGGGGDVWIQGRLVVPSVHWRHDASLQANAQPRGEPDLQAAARCSPACKQVSLIC
jgi:hypothetical protein